MKTPNYLKHLTAVVISLFILSCEKEDEKNEPIVKTSLTFSQIYTTNGEDISNVEIKENSIYIKDTKKLIKNMVDDRYNMIDSEFDKQENKLSETQKKRYINFQKKYDNRDKKLIKELNKDIEIEILNNKTE